MYVEANAYRYITPLIKQTKTNKKGLKPGTTWSHIDYSTTKPMGKEGMVHEFGSFHIGN